VSILFPLASRIDTEEQSFVCLSQSIDKVISSSVEVADECASLCADFITAIEWKENMQSGNPQTYINLVLIGKETFSTFFSDLDTLVSAQPEVSPDVKTEPSELDNFSQFIDLYDLVIKDYKTLNQIDYDISQVKNSYTVYMRSLDAYRDSLSGERY